MQTLAEFGFGPYASRAYLALLELGPADARAVSREARIPAPKVYGTLHQLMERGLVRLVIDTPRRYEPIPFAEFLELQRGRHLDEADRLARAAPKLASLFPTSTARPPASDRGGVAVVRGRGPILRLHRQLAAAVDDEMLILPSRGALLRPQTLAAIVADASAAGVRARILVGRDDRADAFLKSVGKLADVRTLSDARAAEDVTVACFDGTQTVVTRHIPDDASGHDGQDVAYHVDEEAIARSMRDGVALRWAEAIRRAGKRSKRAR